MALLAGIHHPSNQLSLLTIFQLTENRCSNRSRLEALVQILAEHYQVQDLLVEGGGSVNAAAFQAGIVDEVYLTLCPKGAGGREIPPRLKAMVSSWPIWSIWNC